MIDRSTVRMLAWPLTQDIYMFFVLFDTIQDIFPISCLQY